MIAQYFKETAKIKIHKRREIIFRMKRKINQKNARNNIKNSQRGITLVALVVTIIVLIILAGVSINLVLGENRNN